MYIFFSADKVCPCQHLLKLPLVLLFLCFDLLQQLETSALVLTPNQLQMTLAKVKLNTMLLCIIMNIEKMHRDKICLLANQRTSVTMKYLNSHLVHEKDQLLRVRTLRRSCINLI